MLFFKKTLPYVRHLPAPNDIGGAEGGGITSPDTGSMLGSGSTQSAGGSLVILVQIQCVFVGEE